MHVPSFLFAPAVANALHSLLFTVYFCFNLIQFNPMGFSGLGVEALWSLEMHRISSFINHYACRAYLDKLIKEHFPG